MFSKFQKFLTALAVASLISSFSVTGANASGAENKKIENTLQLADYGKMPLLFEQNKGQTDREAKFIARGPGYHAYLAENKVVFSLKRESEDALSANAPELSDKHKTVKTTSDRLVMEFAGANDHPAISGENGAITKTNYYIGKRRFENVSNYHAVNYSNVYDGIDAVFYGNAGKQLEYDFTVAPNADAGQVALSFEGAKEISIDESGNLRVKTENSELVQQKPFAYQIIEGERREVSVSYAIAEQSQIANRNSQISFQLGEYDKSQPLVIDPALNYLTYIGGTAFDDTFEVAADAQGNAYITGATASLNFHGQTRDSADAQGAYVAKLNPAGTAFVYITILEGNDNDTARGIALDANNNAFVTGIASRFFPTTSGAYDTNHGTLNDDDAFVAKLNATGGLVYSSFLGGADSDEGFDIAVDASGKAYVAGNTFSAAGFPTKNRFQGCGLGFPVSLDSLDAFLTVLNSSGSDITYSSCIGGNLTQDKTFSIALDSSNNAYLTGLAKGGNFPTKNAFQPNSGGGIDAWVAKFNPSLSGNDSLIYSTYIGGVGTDQGNGVAVDANGQAVVVGLTGSTNFPLANAFRSTNQINEGFVSVIGSGGSTLVNSSFLGGADQDRANNVALDATGSIYVTGSTLSNDFPMALPFQAARRGVRDAFVAKVKFGRGVISSSYIGGNGDDNGDGIAVKGNLIFVGGDTASTNLLTTPGVVKQTTNNADGFVAKILDTRLDSVGVFRPASTFLVTQSITNIASQTLTLTGGLAGTKGVSGDWNGDGIDTIGSFTDGAWKVRNVTFTPLLLPPITFNFGLAGDRPVVGDWDGDGIDTAGTFRPSTGQFFLTNSPTAAGVNSIQQFGIAEDLPIAGDWDGDGIDTIGVFRPSTSQIFLTNSTNPAPTIDFVTVFGLNGDLPFAGDFNGDGLDSIGVWRPSTTEFFITNNNVNLVAQFPFGAATDQPIIGDWDGRPLP